jgi:hypothetical protein
MQKALTGIVLLLMAVGVHAQWNTTASPPNISFTGGNVGIGTSAPARQLHVSGSGVLGVEALIESTDDTYAMLELKANGKSWQWSKRPGSESNSLLLVYNDGSTWIGPMLSITPNGGVGIGTDKTADANYRLFVETGIRTRKVVVDQATWPDYVFYPDYASPSLSDVAAYIKAHHHLPDMPSADSVVKNGIDLGNNQAQLLKKIEELTLYTIDQQQQLEELKRQNKMMQQQMEALMETIKTRN